jgi:hypothetical protein
MSFHGLERRFGITAVDKGLITADQLIEAMTLQIREELAHRRHRPVGHILVELGYLSRPQVREVLIALGLKPTFLRSLSKCQGTCLPETGPGESATA